MEALVAPAVNLEVGSVFGAGALEVFRRPFPVRLSTSGADRVPVDAAFLRAAFRPRDAPVPGAALSVQAGGGVRVAVGAPREVIRVDLKPGRAARTVALHRVDGAAVAPATTAIASGTTTSTGFVAPTFVLRGVEVADVAAVSVRSYPTGTRLGLAPVEDAALEAVFFWRNPGEVKGTVDSLDVGADLRTALERLLDALDTIPSAVDVAVVAESDAPCLLDLTALRVRYHLARERFPDASEKRTLRLAAGETQSVEVALPTGARVRAAVLRTVESFGSDRPVDGGTTSVPGERRGLRVGTQRWVAAAVELDGALAASGVSLALAGVADRTDVVLQLQEDANGRPSGKALAEGELSLDGAERRWLAATFAEEVTLFAQPYWLVVRAAKGEAVWLVDGGGTTRVTARADGGRGWTPEAGYDDCGPLAKFLSRGRATAAIPPVKLDIDGTAVSASRSDGEAVYDITAPFAAGGSEADLAFTAAAAGFVTVYPPVVEYDL